MSRRKKEFRLRIATAGADTVSGNVDLTFTSELVDIRSFGGQEVLPREVRVQSLPWQIGVVDKNETLTAALSDSDGAANLQMRLADVSEKVNGGSWNVLSTGRVQDITARDAREKKFTVSMTDELALLRQQTIGDVVSATTSIFPYGLLSEWKDYPSIGNVHVRVTDVTGSAVTLRVLEESQDDDAEHRHFVPKNDSGSWGLDSNAVTFLRGDTLGADDDTGAQGGNFRHAVAHVDGSDHGLAWGNLVPPRPRLFIHNWQGTTPSPGNEFTDFYIYAPGHPPTKSVPYHLGGKDGKHYAQLAKDLLTSASNRVDTASFDALIDKDGPLTWPRVTTDEPLIQWIEDKLLGPNGVVLYTKTDGQIAAKSIRLPDASDISNPANLTTLDETKVRRGENVSFNHRGNEMVTRVRGKWRGESDVEPYLKRPGGGVLGIGDREKAENVPSNFDMFDVSDNADTVSHTNESSFGTREVTFDLSAFQSWERAQKVLEDIAENTFARYAVGPIQTELSGLSDLSDLSFGQFVTVDLPYYPNLENQSRGGSRIMQVIRFVPRKADVAVELLDAGPDLQPLSAPTVTISQNSSVPKHRVDINVTGTPSASGGKLVVQVADAATKPASTSDAWETVIVADSDGTYTGYNRPSGSTHWARARAIADGRIASDWATSSSVDTDSYTAPSSLTVDENGGCFVQGSWSNGTTELVTEILLDGTVIDTASEGESENDWYGLTTGTTYTLGVRHADEYGGVTSTATVDVTTDASADQAPYGGPTLVIAGERA